MSRGRRRTRAFLGLSLSLAFGGGLLLQACFIESATPTTFRFLCEADAECPDPEVCAAGLCQQPCGGEDDSPCDPAAPVCFNGFCSSVCPVDTEVCPGAQECMSLSGSESGICTVPCDADTRPCPQDDVCFEGACVSTCMDDIDCGLGESCLGGANICVPN